MRYFQRDGIALCPREAGDITRLERFRELGPWGGSSSRAII
ncbi:MAG: hypothetical protein O7A65_10020 [Proteobacteria bacterium]|nr:hypothetical protein [Pseudomonadota bacterium]